MNSQLTEMEIAHNLNRSSASDSFSSPTLEWEWRYDFTSPARILYVDDDVSIRRLAQLVLRHEGHQVDIAVDGAKAWDALCDQNCQLLITDYKMPNSSGVELLRKVRQERLPLRTILASGSLDELPVDELKTIECGQFLAKPFTCVELLQEVREALKRPAARKPTLHPHLMPSRISGSEAIRRDPRCAPTGRSGAPTSIQPSLKQRES